MPNNSETKVPLCSRVFCAGSGRSSARRKSSRYSGTKEETQDQRQRCLSPGLKKSDFAFLAVLEVLEVIGGLEDGIVFAV